MIFLVLSDFSPNELHRSVQTAAHLGRILNVCFTSGVRDLTDSNTALFPRYNGYAKHKAGVLVWCNSDDLRHIFRDRPFYWSALLSYDNDIRCNLAPIYLDQTKRIKFH